MTVQRERRRWLIAVSLVLVLVLAGCTGQAPNQSSSEKEKLKVGAILPLSGQSANIGNEIKRGMEVAREELAAEGIELEVVYEDNQASPKKGLTAFQKLRTENVDVVVSILGSVVKPLVSKAQNNKLPLVTTLTLANIENQSDYVFRLDARPGQVGSLPFRKGIVSEGEDIGILYLNNEYGVSIKNAIKDAAERNNVDVAADEAFMFDETSFQTQLTKIKSENPDNILFVGFPSHTIQILKKSKELGINSTLVETSFTMQLESVREKAGEAANGAYAEAYPAFLQRDSDFMDSYRQKYDREPSYMAPLGYDVMRLIGKATEGRSLGGAEAASRLRNYGTYKSLNGEVQVQKNGEINLPLNAVKVVNGSLQRVE